MYTDLNKARQSFISSTVCKDPRLYRPPYGSTNDTVRSLTQKLGMRGVLWNLDTEDWKAAVGLTPAQMYVRAPSPTPACAEVLLGHVCVLS